MGEDLPPEMYLIRLQGPWKWGGTPGAAVDIGGAAGEVHGIVRLPWGEGGPTDAVIGLGEVWFLRRFHRPTNLDPEERVLLVLPPGSGEVAVLLGERSIGGGRWIGKRAVWDLTPHLEPSNELRLVFAGQDWQQVLRTPVLLGVMPDAGGGWWAGLPLVEGE